MYGFFDTPFIRYLPVYTGVLYSSLLLVQIVLFIELNKGVIIKLNNT